MRRVGFAAIIVIGAIMLMLPSSGLAVHDTGLFELDGNATTDHVGAGLPDDWDRVCHQVLNGDCSTTFNTSAKAVSWIAEPNLNSTIFQTGGSKDPQDIPNWVWKDDAGGLPDKDNLLHSFAARYSVPPSLTCPSGGAPTCDILYFGSDRYDNSGDAQQGFWFFQNPVGLSNTPAAGGFQFTGKHTTGDLLVITDFSNGGGTSSITVYQWDPTCLATNNPVPACADNNLRTLASSGSANCATAGALDAFCGVVNAGTIIMPWSFADKSGTPNNGALAGEFFEGGINLSLLGLGNECFSSVASETRSSTSTTATLKDFVLGNFGQCPSALTTTPRDGAGGAIPGGGLSIGTGSVSVRDSATLTVNGANNWSGTLKFFLCKVDAPGTCTSPNGVQIGATQNINQATPQPILSSAATVTSAGRYCWRGEFVSNTNGVPDSTDDTVGECFVVNPVTPTLTTNAIAAVAVGGAITDSATLTGTANQPGNPIIDGPLGAAAGGSITFRLYGPNDLNCANAPVFTSAPVPVSGDGIYGPASFTPTVAGIYRWIASYSGNLPNTNAQSGACNDANETTRVVDANISITPNGTNRVGDSHTFTAHVNVNDGTGFANAPDGTQISFTIDSGPGSFTTPNPCTTAGGTGSCTITLTSAVTGVTVVSAHTTLAVAGVQVTRHTNGTGGSSGPASKTWVNARISIAPNATNAVGQPHTFTVTLEKDLGDGAGFVPFAGAHVDFTLTDAGGASHSAPTGTCTNAGPNTNASGQCTITFTSNSAGTVTGHASWTGTLGTPNPFTVQTNGVAPNSGDAVKQFVDANIQLTPANATNAVNTNHVLTITVNALNGTIDAGPHTATASIVSGPGSFVGPNTCTYQGGAATASCTVTITSAVAGTTVVSATSDIPVNGQTITRTTNTAANTAAGGSGNASKVWVDANIQITPATATNAVNTNHVLTITVNALNGTIDPGPHTATASIVSGPGSFVGPATCTYVGGAATASCTVTITSAVTGTTVVSATSNIPVNGQTITRTTGTAVNTAAGGSGNASKVWVDANIQITPANDTNAVNTNHVLTITVNAVNGTIDAGPHTATASIVSGPGSFVGPNTCTYQGGAATASCTVTITSAVTGTTVVSATSDIPVNGQTITRTTNTALNTAAGGSGNASKVWVDANIQITPANATNAVNTNHVLTMTVNAVNGQIDAGPHTATASIVSGPGSFVGGNTCTYQGGAATASCTVTITSATTGTTVVSATSDILVNGQTITRTTGTAVNTAAGGSGNASKVWVDANIQITPANATNAVNTNHVLTITVNAVNGTIDAGPHTATASIVSGPGNFVGPATCTYVGGAATASCTVTITSAVAGTTVVSATSNIPVNGQTITRTTGTAVNTAAGGSGNASKVWVDANIQITPPNATNAINTNHVLTITVNAINGTIDPGPHTATASIVNGPGSFVGPATCTYVGGAATASCTVTITSGVTGTTEISATSDIPVNGQTITRTTGTAVNAAAGGSGNALKQWVNARISIAPDATNEVGQPHTFTVTLEADTGNGFGPAPNEHVDVVLTGANGAVQTNVSGTCTQIGPNTNAQGQCTITFTSLSAGTVTGHASATMTVNGVQFTIQTTGQGGNSPDAVKRFVDAKIEITPNQATNRVNDPHTFIVTLRKDVGDGAGFVAAANEHVDVALIDNLGATHSAPTGTCTNAGGNTNAQGQCTITFTSNSTGTVTGHATSTLTISGVVLTRATNGVAPNSADANKLFVNARIAIAPDATNRVGQPHTFTVTLEKDLGNGAGFVPAAGEHVDVALSDHLNASHTAPTGTCTNAGANTDAQGRCTITFTSNTTGTVTGHATSSVNIAGAQFSVATDGQGQNSGDATKRFVDAQIAIGPSATNAVGQPHTFTVTLLKDLGDGNGLVAAAGEHADVTLTDAVGASHTVPTGTCTNAGANTDAQGQCTITFTSNTAGTVTGHATSSLSVVGVPITVATGAGANSGDAVKTFVSAKIEIIPDATHEVGQPHTFTVTLSKDLGAGGFVPAQGEHVDVTLTDANGAVHTEATETAAPATGTCTNAGANTDANGQCTIRFTSLTGGTVTGHAFAALVINGVNVAVATNGIAPNSGDAVARFVDANIQITPAAANNPISTNHTLTGHVNVNEGAGGFANAPAGTTITFSLTNSGGASAAFVGPNSCTTAGATGSCTVVIRSSTVGTTTIKASTDVTVRGVTLHRASGDARAGDSGDATKTWADDTVRTDILNASGNVVTSVVSGTVVHDKVFVAKAAGTPASVPNPTGNVIFHRYATIDCTGTATNQTVALTPGSPSTAITDDFAPTANMSYAAEYLGDANYPPRTGACEPLTVTPVAAPAIAVVKNPKNQTVAVGGTATFTVTVTNAGNTVLTDVHVDDPLTPNCSKTKADIPALASMDPGAVVTYTCTKTNVRSAFDNVATATGTPPSGPNVTASDIAPVKVKALKPVKKKVKKKKKPKVVSHKKPKATG